MKPIPKIIISRPKLNVDYCCPKCKEIAMISLSEYNITCKNCRTKITTDVEVNITFSVWKNLMGLLAHNNEVHLVGQIYSKDIVDLSDSIAQLGKHDDDIKHAMLAIKDTMDKQLCYEVSDITVDNDIINETRCKDCGYCFNCKQCKNCGAHYTPKEVKVRDGTQKRYACPECGSHSYTQSRIDKVVRTKDNKAICPHCKSEHISMSTFNISNNSCPKCNSKNIELPKKIKVLKLIIRRQKRNEIKEAEVKL